MAAWLGSYGPAEFGGADLPWPGAVVMQYTGLSEHTENDPPTYVNVGTNDGIASWRTMERRLKSMKESGIPTEFHAYEGLYFQGAAQNLRSENFGFEAQKYNENMIVVAPQLSDWGETSANQTIALAEYFLKHYNIDESRVYANGYSGGGETMSLVMGKRPELFTAYLHCSSQWDGDLNVLAKSRTPVYLAVGREDEYYGSEQSQKVYNTLHKLYREQGLSEEEIGRLLVLDIKERSYFTSKGNSSQRPLQKPRTFAGGFHRENNFPFS